VLLLLVKSFALSRSFSLKIKLILDRASMESKSLCFNFLDTVPLNELVKIANVLWMVSLPICGKLDIPSGETSCVSL
jgi:hypothetical protein